MAALRRTRVSPTTATSTLLCYSGMEGASVFEQRLLSGQESDHKFRGYLDCQLALWLPEQVQCSSLC